ncbi:IgGFc-binding protein [Mizuhopecten yessoensis]|uniref:IgGFc-binding protein n=1 Tax=Mizuhopecten yessoensis TaxID=6573 RepID=A0A210R613_MIZYE|nr:IgGFc-binding protein [Mizuhopecten yessoensis]
MGTEFLFMFCEHYIKGSIVKVFCSTPLNSEVSVRIQTPVWDAGTIDITVTVTPGSVTEVDLPRSLRMTGTGKGKTSILVTASDTITVYAADTQANTGDTFMVYPTDALGSEYIDITYNQTSTSYASSLGIVALYDLTVVEIDPPPGGSISYDGTDYTAGQILTVTINKYELFQIQSHDLSGTHVRSSFPLSVISAHEYIRMGTSNSKDFMQTMLPPVSSLSTTYVVFGFPMYSKPEIVRIVNSRENTTIIITLPSVSVFLEKIGSMYDIEVAPGVGSVITADKGVIVALVSQSRSMSPYGDPRVIVALSADQFLSEYTFPIANLTGKVVFTHRIVIMAKTSDVSNIKLDNSYIADLGLVWTELINTNLSVTFTILDVGVHSLTSDDVTSVFGGYLAGHGSTEEYGTLTGRYLGNTNQVSC